MRHYQFGWEKSMHTLAIQHAYEQFHRQLLSKVNLTEMKINDVKVKLSRSSSAVPLAIERRRQSVIEKREFKDKFKDKFKLKEMADENQSYDTTTGKLPVEAALTIMRRIHEETGYPLDTSGHTAYDKLSSIRVDPALDLLKEKTWREFFDSKTKDHMHLSNILTATNEANPTTTVKDSQKMQQQLEIKRSLDDIFERLIYRVDHYWSVLKIPEADQSFYLKSLCKGPPKSFDQCLEISSYITMLKSHEQATISVIQAIQVREVTITKAFDVLAALQRKITRGFYSRDVLPSPLGRLSGSVRPMSANQAVQSSYDRSELDSSSSSFWKEELLSVLDDVRMCTIEVIRRVQSWRRHLWRPHPFVYTGQNYLVKMKDDLSILHSDIYARVLSLLPLRYEDLQCIVFFPIVRGSSSMPPSKSAHRSSSPTHVPHFPPVSSSNQRDSQLHSGDLHSSSNNHNERSDRLIEQLIYNFSHKVDAQELELAATIILEEDQLQSALTIEQASLQQKGVFIPTLRLKPGSNSFSDEST